MNPPPITPETAAQSAGILYARTTLLNGDTITGGDTSLGEISSEALMLAVIARGQGIGKAAGTPASRSNMTTVRVEIGERTVVASVDDLACSVVLVTIKGHPVVKSLMRMITKLHRQAHQPQQAHKDDVLVGWEWVSYRHLRRVVDGIEANACHSVSGEGWLWWLGRELALATVSGGPMSGRDDALFAAMAATSEAVERKSRLAAVLTAMAPSEVTP